MTSQAASARNTLWKVLLPVAVIIALSAGALHLIKSQVAKPTGSSVEIIPGATLPDFTLNRLEGGKIKASELKSRVLLVNFWATWCEACMVEMPSIIKLRNKFKERGFEVAGVNLDENPAAVAPKAIKQLGINFPVFTDPDSDLADLFSVHAIPLTVILDKDRKVLFVEPGERDWMETDIQAKIEGWLAQ